MPFPVADSYNVASGASVYAGRYAAAVLSGAVTLEDAVAAGYVAGGAALADGISIASFTLTSPSTATAPFALGHVFERGAVPASTLLTGAGMQVDVMTRWDDNSARIAVVSGVTSLTAAVAKTMTIATGVGTGSALTTADLKATGAVANVDCGAFGAVNWAATDWDTPFQLWVSGPKMSSWVYRKPVGSDAHLVAWLEVRLFSNGAVDVLPWLENGYLQVASPTNKSATYTFTLGGAIRFSAAIDLKHHQRTPLVSGAMLSHWLGTDPAVTPRHDVAYMQRTEVVPTYRATISPSADSVTALPSTFSPLQQGSFAYYGDSMGASGYQAPIGLLPQHDMLYLVCTAPEIYAAVVRNGYSAGRYGIHYRDEATNRPLKFSQHATLVIADYQGVKDNGASAVSNYTTTATGGNPPGWDIAHSPSVGFMAYLLTGRYYFLEQVQFAATLNGIMKTDFARAGQGAPSYQPQPGYTGASCVFSTSVDAFQTRASAWGVRTLAQALCVTPPSDSIYPDLLASMEDNCRFFSETYIASNPFGVISPGESYSGITRQIAVWQQDFVTAAWGYAKAMNLPLSQAGHTRMANFFAWKAKTTIVRLGTSADFWYINGNAYTAIFSPNSSPDYQSSSEPWYTPAEAYAATYAGAAPGTTEGVLAFDYDDASAAVRGMWGNLMPAIAYAIRHGVSGAQAAYNRMVGASNWSALTSQLNVFPVWSVREPVRDLSGSVTLDDAVASGTMSGYVLPTWLAGQPLNTWISIPSTSGAGGAAINSFSMFVVKQNSTELIIAAAGGHLDSSDNRVTSIKLSDDAPAWVVRKSASASVQESVLYYSDGLPTSRHNYQHNHYIASIDAVLMAGCRFGYGGYAAEGPGMDLFSLSTNQWLPRYTYPDIPGSKSFGIVKDGQERVWTSTGQRFDPATSTWTSTGATLPRYPSVYDPLRDQIFSLQCGNGEDGVQTVVSQKVACGTALQTTVTFNASAALTQFTAAGAQYLGMDYDAPNDRFLATHQGESGVVYVITPNSGSVWDIGLLSVAGSVGVGAGGTNKKFQYISSLKGFALITQASSNIYFLRTA